ncbi:MAG: hypothetical protein ACE5JG_08700 [Planctomycetota bacterium]
MSEEGLLEAADAAGLSAGMTVLDLDAGTGGVAIFLAEELHVHVRGVVSAPGLLALARRRAAVSRAAGRVRFRSPEGFVEPGPYDLVCSLGAAARGPDGLPGGGARQLVGRPITRRGPLPPPVEEVFAPAAPARAGQVVWQREATPLEVERFFAPQERALRVWKRRRKGARSSEVAAQTSREIETFRSYGSYVGWELSVRSPKRAAGPR